MKCRSYHSSTMHFLSFHCVNRECILQQLFRTAVAVTRNTLLHIVVSDVVFAASCVFLVLEFNDPLYKIWHVTVHLLTNAG